MEPGSRRPGPAGEISLADAGFMQDDEDPHPALPHSALAVEVVLAEPAWRRLVPRAETLARRAVAAALRETGAAGSVSVLLADDRALKRLNGEHRGKDKPTNVLSFPGLGPHLGDIALAFGVVRREARAAGRRPEAHFAHLVAHGALHLVGHDHLAAGEARRMERAEARAMYRLRLPNPWRPDGGREVMA
ncbi:rRNA maturation RNase YbeY [Roseicella sp. DB1501]|nr:rRNA maturation RNase YbeY [Roseicella sp. DB1501]